MHRLCRLRQPPPSANHTIAARSRRSVALSLPYERLTGGKRARPHVSRRLRKGGTMGYRVFTDSQGVEWQTRDVGPHLAERRAAERRRRDMAPPSAVERRRANDRRVVSGRRPMLSAG